MQQSEFKPVVQLLAHTPEPEKLVAAAAKLCYSSSTVEGLYDSLTEENTADFVKMLAGLGHASPTEHVSFTFAIEGVSRAFLAQITRHRIASYSVQSQRYVTKDNFEYITPPEIAKSPKAEALYQQAMQDAEKAYAALIEELTETHTKTLMDEGKSERTARRDAEKKAAEDARFVLPNACDTKMVVTMNVRSLQNFFSLRCCQRAQWEIREVAIQMLRLVKGVAPNLFSKAGPGCLRGPCPEGKMTCGKIKEVREFFTTLEPIAEE